MSVTIQAKEKVIDRIVMAKRLGGRHLAEAEGLLRALSGLTPAQEIYASPELQARYLLGFHEGSEILRVESHFAVEPGRTA